MRHYFTQFALPPITLIGLLLVAPVANAQTVLDPNKSLLEMPHYVVIGPNPDLQSLTYPTGYSLMVIGGILTERLRVATRSGQYWADYVFKPGYRLAPLGEVKHYIAQHGHLPGVPSAQEVEREGIDVAQTQAILLEKIEELTLHVIRQQEQINRLARQVRMGKSQGRVRRQASPVR